MIDPKIISKNITVADIVQIGTKRMRKAKLHPHFFGNHSLKGVANYLTFFVLGLPHQYSNPEYLNKILNENEVNKILSLFERRIVERIPLEYISQEAYYLGRPFYVNEHVLVPRSLMNTRFEDFLSGVQWQNYRVLDLCTGSGCIGITLALLNPKILVDLADLSYDALEVAKINIDRYSLKNRVRCIQSDLFANIQNKYDMIISNPPYVSDYEYKHQPLEVKNEPSVALLGGRDGLDIVNQILMNAKNYLNPHGILICEVGYSSAKLLKKRYKKIPFQWFKYRQPSGKESLLDKFIKWIGYLDSVFLCNAKDLP